MDAAAEMKELFEEYEAGETPEALLVKDFDKVHQQIIPPPPPPELSPEIVMRKLLAHCIHCSAQGLYRCSRT